MDGRNDEVFGNLDDPCNPYYDNPNTRRKLDNRTGGLYRRRRCASWPYHQSVDLARPDPLDAEHSPAVGAAHGPVGHVRRSLLRQPGHAGRPGPVRGRRSRTTATTRASTMAPAPTRAPGCGCAPAPRPGRTRTPTTPRRTPSGRAVLARATTGSPTRRTRRRATSAGSRARSAPTGCTCCSWWTRQRLAHRADHRDRQRAAPGDPPGRAAERRRALRPMGGVPAHVRSV